MIIARHFVSVAVLAGWIVVGSPGIASAAPALSGHYIATVTSEAGETTSSDWYFTPCGEACASVAGSPGGPVFGHARLADGHWTLVWHSDAFCPSGTRVPGAYASYASWDANSLAGKDESGILMPICGSGGRPGRVTQDLQLTPVG